MLAPLPQFGQRPRAEDTTPVTTNLRAQTRPQDPKQPLAPVNAVIPVNLENLPLPLPVGISETQVWFPELLILQQQHVPIGGSWRGQGTDWAQRGDKSSSCPQVGMTAGDNQTTSPGQNVALTCSQQQLQEMAHSCWWPMPCSICTPAAGVSPRPMASLFSASSSCASTILPCPCPRQNKLGMGFSCCF